MADKRELILDLLARDKTGQATKSAAKNLDGVGDSAGGAGKKTEQFGKASVVAGQQTEKLGDKATQAARNVTKLDHEIGLVNRELQHLATAFAAASTQAERLDISKGIRRAENDLRRLNKSKGLLEGLIPDDPDPGAMRAFGQKLAKGISGSIASSPWAVAAAGVVVGVMSPVLGAGIAGAIIGGVGLGGIVGGAALAAKDPAIAGYAQRIGQTFTKNVTAEAQVFHKPILASLGIIEAGASRSGAKIGKIFDNTAGSVKPLTASLVRAGDALLDSFVEASENSAPALESLGHLVEDVSGHVAKMIATLSQYGDEGASAIDDIGTSIGFVVDRTTDLIRIMAIAKGVQDGQVDTLQKTGYWLEDNIGWLDITADGYKKGSAEAEAYRRVTLGTATAQDRLLLSGKPALAATKALADGMTEAQRAANAERTALSQLSKELKAQTDPVLGLLNAQDGLQQAQTAAAAATKKYGANSDQARAASRRFLEASIELQGRVGELGASFNGKMTPALRRTLIAAGATKGQIAAVAAEFRRAKRDGDRFAKTYRAELVLKATLRGFSDFTGIGGSTFRGMSSGGPVRGPGAKGVDSKPTLLAPGEHVLTARQVDAIGGHGAVEGLLRSARSGRPSTAPAQPAGAGSGNTSGGILQLEVVGEQQVVAFLRSLIRRYNLLQPG